MIELENKNTFLTGDTVKVKHVAYYVNGEICINLDDVDKEDIEFDVNCFS
jgi:hypothetical protein